MRNSLITALAAGAGLPSRRKTRRFLSGLSCGELQFIAEFVGCCILESDSNYWHPSHCAALKPGSEDRALKMVLAMEYLGRAGVSSPAARRIGVGAKRGFA